jgi:tetratricopeptide (TPR) repeat protein
VRKFFGLIQAGAFLAAALAAAAYPTPLQLYQANEALQAGEADKALALLNMLTQPGGVAEAFNLRCRVEFTLEEWDRAANDCGQAVKMDGANSMYHLWLGRALGEKASRASFISAYSLAKQVRGEFETATRLNPRNADALSDLGEFYYSAPGVVGGGLSKAESLEAQLDGIDPAQAQELRAAIAEERKDFGTAEREFKQAVAVSAHPAFQWMALAGFYHRRQRWTEMEAALRSGENAAERDKRSTPALFNGANVLRLSNRDPELAVKMLEEYLAGSARSEQAPAFVAHTWLARFKAQLGDAAAASRERAAALALASEYKPALDLKH